MFGFSTYEKALAAEVLWLRSQLEKQQERNDRLTEALAKKNDLQLIMPQTPIPYQVQAPSGQIEKGSGWFDNKPIPVIQKTGGNSR